MATKIKHEIVTTINALQNRKLKSGQKVVLAGQPVFSSLAFNLPPGFIKQTSREATAGILAQFQKNAPKLCVAVDTEVFQHPKARFALAIDGYLAWGLKNSTKGATVLLGGGETDDEVKLEIMVFNDGRLVEMREKKLPPLTSTVFQDTLQLTIEHLRVTYRTARYVQAAPLTNWMYPGVEYIGDAPLRGLSFRPLLETTTSKSHLVLPAAIAAAGLLVIYPAAVVIGWGAYTNAVADYEHEISDPAIKSKGGMDTEFLNIMNARRMYMEQPRRQIQLAEKSAEIVQGIASIPGLRIYEIKLPAPGAIAPQSNSMTFGPSSDKVTPITKDSTPDIWLSVSAPKSADPAIIQAKAVMTQIANQTGMQLRINPQAWRDVQNRRVFDIEGFIHG